MNDLKPGDHVVMVFMPSCGHCLPCAEGRPALCEEGAAANAAGTLVTGAVRLSYDGGHIHHHLVTSASVTRKLFDRIPEDHRDLPFRRKAALFGCAVLTGVRAVVNTARDLVAFRCTGEHCDPSANPDWRDCRGKDAERDAASLALSPLGGLLRGRLAAVETVIVSGATGAYGTAATLLAIAMARRAVGRNAAALDALAKVGRGRVMPVAVSGDSVKRHKVDREIDLKSSHRQIRERAISENRFLSTRCRIIDVKSSHLAGRLTPSMTTF